MKIALVIFITLALAGCALLSLHMGVIPVPWRALLTDWQAGHEHYYVLMEYRLPRLLLALFVGAALAVAGVLIQGIRECCQIDRLPSSYFGRAVLKYWLGQ